MALRLAFLFLHIPNQLYYCLIFKTVMNMNLETDSSQFILNFQV